MKILRSGLVAVAIAGFVLGVPNAAYADAVTASDNSVKDVDTNPGTFTTVKTLSFVLSESSELFVRYDLGQSHDCCHHQASDLRVLVDGNLEVSDSVPFARAGAAPGPNHKLVGPVSIGVFGSGSHSAQLQLGDAGRNTIFEIFAEPADDPRGCSGPKEKDKERKEKKEKKEKSRRVDGQSPAVEETATTTTTTTPETTTTTTTPAVEETTTPETTTTTTTTPVGPLCFGEPAGPRANGGVVIIGTEVDDVLTGSAGPDLVCALGGNDDVRGQAGDDRLDGGAGDDQLFGGEGNDELRGDAGADNVFGEAGDDQLFGGADNDGLLVGGDGADTIHGDDGDDALTGDRIFGGGAPGNDVLLGGPGNDGANGGEGTDRCEAETTTNCEA
ncbi:MAG: hypothetical protein M3P53_09240 [Actinomycetota bacterium]|nr:hypothetical protein [Actinomycetota bacterium]